MKSNIATIAALVNAYPDAAAQKQIRCAFQKLGREVMNDSPQTFWDNREMRLQGLDAIENKKSRSAYKSQIVKALHWACDQGIIDPVTDSDKTGSSYPLYADVAAGMEKNSAAFKTVWNAFLRFVSSRHILLSELKAEHLVEFQLWLMPQVFDGKRSWNVFATQWETAAGAGIVPSFGLKVIKPKKAEPYALAPEALPEVLQIEFKAAVDRQEEQLLGNRFQQREVAGTTVELRTAILLRYLGWRALNGACFSSVTSLADLITKEDVLGYLRFTNGDRGIDDMGEYQESILINLDQFVCHGLLHQEKADMIYGLWSFHRRSFFGRREVFKPVISLDDVYRIISTLLEESNNNSLCTRNRALLVRDAVVILLLASFGFRRDILLRLHLGSTFRESHHNGQYYYLIDIPKEVTKPKLRDCYYQIAHQYYTVIKFYCTQIRPYLLRNSQDDGYLLRAQGGNALSSQSVYRIVVKRSEQVLGVRLNPHMVRKALATEWVEDNPKDLLTLSLIMDCSVHTIQASYTQSKPKKACQQFDARALKKRSLIGSTPASGEAHHE